MSPVPHLARARLFLCAPLCLALAALGSSPAGAQAPAVEADDVQYQRAIDEAIAHYAAGRFRQALSGFEAAHALQPSARTLRGIGLCASYLGDRVKARQALEAALAETRKPLSEAQRGELQGLLDVAVRETGRFELQLTPASAAVTVDGHPTSERVLVLARGEHELTVDAPGHRSARTPLHVQGGESQPLRIALASVPPTQAPDALDAPPAGTTASNAPPTQPSRPPHATASDGGTPVLAWVAAAAVPVLAGTATAVWLTGKDKRDAIAARCKREGCTDEQLEERSADANLTAHQTWSSVALVGAGVALVTATLLFMLDGGEEAPAVAWTSDGASATLRAEF